MLTPEDLEEIANRVEALAADINDSDKDGLSPESEALFDVAMCTMQTAVHFFRMASFRQEHERAQQLTGR